MNRFSSKGRSRLLITAGTAMAATMIATAAHAGDATVVPGFVPAATVSIDAHDTVNHVQQNVNSVAASVNNSAIQQDNQGTTQTTVTTVTSNTTNLNAIAASATGNDSAANGAIAATETNGGTDDGISTIAGGYNFGPVTAEVGNDKISSEQTDFLSGSISVSNDTIAAAATGNNSTTRVSGAIPLDFDSATVGLSTVDFGTPADWLDVTGSLAASNIQVQSDNFGGPIVNEANADNNDRILLNIINTADDESTISSPVLDDNAISASVNGNSSNTTIDIQSGGNPAYDGTAVVTNAQINSSPTVLGSHITSLADDAQIIATIQANDTTSTDDIELQGALSVQGNTISTSANGNAALGNAAGQAGNRILIGDGLSFAGAGTATPGADIVYNAGTLADTAAADLVIQNSQGNVGTRDTNITAYTHNGEIAGVVDDINGGSVTVKDDHLTADANGNLATSSLASGSGMPSFSGSAAVANQQTNYGLTVHGEAKGDIDARVSDDDNTPNSQVLVDGNSVEGTSYGNSVSQSLSLDAVGQTLPLSGVTLTGGTDDAVTGDGNVHSDGSLTVTNLQSNYNGSVTSRDAHNIYATASLADTVDTSSVDVTNNIGRSITVGSGASNALTLSGTSVGVGAGIESVQIAGGNFTGTAESDGVVQANVGDVDTGSVSVSGNLQSAIAYGGSAGNTLDVTAETVTADGAVAGVSSTVTNVGGSLTDPTQPLVNSAYGLLNVQSLDGTLSATVIPADYADDTSFLLTVDGDVTASGITNGGHVDALTGAIVGGNTIGTAAYGGDATNAASLDVGNLDTSNGDFASVANLSNVQEVSGDSSVSAQIAGGKLAETTVADDVTGGSNVATSYNTAQALAYGNRVGNTVAVTSTNIDTASTTAVGEGMVDGGVATTEASFGLNNVQSVGGDVIASLLNDFIPASATASLSVLTDIGDDVTNSSVSSNGNAMSAAGTGNRANNSIGVSGTGLATTVALTNYQIDPTAISAYVGLEGTGPTPFIAGEAGGTTGNTGNGGGTLSVGGSTLTVSGAPVTVTFGSPLTQAQADYLNSISGISGATAGGTTANLAVGNIDLTNFTSFTFGSGGVNPGDETIALNGFTYPGIPDTPATNGTPNKGGVAIAIGGDIDPSHISVDNNSVSGSVTGNSVTNAASLVGTDVASGSGLTTSQAVATGITTVQADGDVALVNQQTVSAGGSLDSEVYNTFAIDGNDGVDIIDSGLTVDGNKQSSQAIANTGANSVTLSATNSTAGSALASYQESSAGVTALSNEEIFAPVVSSGSSISMSNNANSALAVQNNVTNTLTVDTTNAGPVSGANNAVADVNDATASSTADHALLNEQLSLAGSTATAVSNIYNDDNVDPTTPGLVNGSVDVSGNSTKAQAGGNLADNLANVGGKASLTASAAVTNSQANFGAIEADATTTASVTINGDSGLPAAATTGSSITLGNNTTSSLAQGNAATNVLNYTAGATYGAGTGNASTSTMDVLAFPFAFDESTSAQATVLNFQGNAGNVTANSDQASYLVALNTAAAPTVTNATVNVIGNSVSASAYGNQATNQVTVAALNTDRPTIAIGNYQTNSGAITASVTTVTYGVTSGLGAVNGSSVGVNGNSITATAVGNSAVSTIAAR